MYPTLKSCKLRRKIETQNLCEFGDAEFAKFVCKFSLKEPKFVKHKQSDVKKRASQMKTNKPKIRKLTMEKIPNSYLLRQRNLFGGKETPKFFLTDLLHAALNPRNPLSGRQRNPRNSLSERQREREEGGGGTRERNRRLVRVRRRGERKLKKPSVRGRELERES